MSAPAKPTITKPSRLIAAAKAGEDNLIAEYLTENKKLDVNKRDSLGQTSLHWAAHSGYPTTCELLISFGANPNLQDKLGETPLHKCALRGNVECIPVLISHGADVNIRNEKGMRPIDLARVEEVKRLLAPRVDLGEAVEVPDDEEYQSD